MAIPTTQTNSARPVSNSFFNDMFGGDDSDMSFGLDEETGEMLVHQPGESPAATSSNLNAEEVVDEVDTTATTSAGSSTTSDSATETRIAALEAQLSQTIDLLKQVITQPSRNQTQQETLPPEEELDFGDIGSLKRMIQRTVQESLSTTLAPMQESIQKSNLYMEYSEAAQRHGHDFVEKLPAIKEILTVDPKMGFDKAYFLAKSIIGTVKPANSDGNGVQKSQQSQPKTAVGPAQALTDKVKALKMPSGINAGQGTKSPQITSLRQAMDSAFAEVFSGQA